MTKKQMQMLNNYNRSKDYSLAHAYGRYSRAKERAEYLIREEQNQNNGYDFRITTHSITMFTCAYRMKKGNEEYLVYHTPTNRYEFQIA